ncbi:MAG: stage V sporulation protein AC [Clostridia bacterium]|nr:stage V sporulation protein AC [Clostridia bacterium]
MKNKEYLKTVKSEMPPSRHVKTMVRAFIVGGLICCIGQGISDLLKLAFPAMDKQVNQQFTVLIIIAVTGILTGFGVYDNIGKFGGAGSIIPITGFANSVVAPAIEFKREGYIFGLCANMFTIAGPVIVFGVVSSIIVGLIYLIIGGV